MKWLLKSGTRGSERVVEAGTSRRKKAAAAREATVDLPRLGSVRIEIPPTTVTAMTRAAIPTLRKALTGLIIAWTLSPLELPPRRRPSVDLDGRRLGPAGTDLLGRGVALAQVIYRAVLQVVEPADLTRRPQDLDLIYQRRV